MLSVERLYTTAGSLSLRDVSLKVEAGSYLVLLGASGVGKTVLLETIAGLRRPRSGRILLDGRDITDEKIQHRRVALVFQNSALFPHMSVYGNIAYALRCAGFESSAIRRRVAELAEQVGVARLLDRSAATLSGGETQRVSLARALACEPRCLLLDEPLSSLDTEARTELRALLRRIHRGANRAIVHVTHDYTEAVSLGTHVAVMEHGTIVQAGAADAIFQRPESEFVARFVGVKNFFKGQLHGAAAGPGRTMRFQTDGLEFKVAADCRCAKGFVCIRSEDVTVSNGAVSDHEALQRHGHSSARNNFKGRIVDIIGAVSGVELIIDIGRDRPLELAALVTAESMKLLDLHHGKEVWVSFKASAARFIEQ